MDLSILDEAGKQLDMGTVFDDFTSLAQPRLEADFQGAGKLSGQQVDNRLLLRRVMEVAGFIQLPFSIFSRKSWSPAPKARFVKLHLYFDEPIMVKGLEINDCGSKINPGLSVFFNFDQWILRTDPAFAGAIPDALFPERKGGLLVLNGFGSAIEVRSLTFNFEFNSDFRICGIMVKDPEGETYAIKTPELVAGKVEASSVLERLSKIRYSLPVQ